MLNNSYTLSSQFCTRLTNSTMPASHLISLHVPSALVARSSRAVAQPAAICTPRGVRHQSVTKPWKGAGTEEHSIRRAKRGDTKDPSASAVASGVEEREVNEWIADTTKSQGTTERGGRKAESKAKNDHPAAPEPIIGMNDERGQVRVLFRLP